MMRLLLLCVLVFLTSSASSFYCFSVYVIIGFCLLFLSFVVPCLSIVGFGVCLHVCVPFGLGSVSGGVCSFSVVLFSWGFRRGCCSSCMLFSMLFHVEGLVLLDSLQFEVLLLIAFAFRFRSIPLLAHVALVQAWVGPQVGA